MTNIEVSAATPFTFNGSMSKEVLRNYASRAVTYAGFAVENLDEDAIFEEGLRMICRTGAKYIHQAAYYSWGGIMSNAQVEEHFRIAKEKAALAHKADPELILGGGIFEIVYLDTASAIPIPPWVFEAFGLPVETRNFRGSDISFPAGHEYGVGFWGNDGSGVPNIDSLETQMYFYWQICRYIDAGYESVHLGNTELMMGQKNYGNAVSWEHVLTLARKYAKTHARRGVVLFDGMCELFKSPGLKVEDRLVLDLYNAEILPDETKKENGAMMCTLKHNKDYTLSQIGKTKSGWHPLGFYADDQFTILQFGNDGYNGRGGVATPGEFWNWGYDDVIWLALQPEWYRNQFLLECDEFLKKTALDAEGKQVYFLQPSFKRVMSVSIPDITDYEQSGTAAVPQLTYKPGVDFDMEYTLKLFAGDKTVYEYDEKTHTFHLTLVREYRANYQGDGCPVGFGQEDTVRQIFLGKNAPEDPALLPVGYNSSANPTDPSAPSGPAANQSPLGVTRPSKLTSGTSTNNADASDEWTTEGTAMDEEPETSEGQTSDETASEEQTSKGQTSRESDATKTSGTPASKRSPLPLILGIAGAVLLLGGGFTVWMLVKRKSAFISSDK